MPGFMSTILQEMIHDDHVTRSLDPIGLMDRGLCLSIAPEDILVISVKLAPLLQCRF